VKVLLEAKNLIVYYDTVLALDDISLTVGDGEIVAMIGPNGAGKSTALKAICGLVKPKSGEVLFQGENINGKQPYQLVEKGLCLVPEGRRVFTSMSVLENLELLLLDEPSLGLSPNYVNTVFEKIKEINKDGTTILLVEQNARMALEYADRGYVFEIGKIAFEDKAKNLLENDKVRKSFLGGI